MCACLKKRINLADAFSIILLRDCPTYQLVSLVEPFLVLLFNSQIPQWPLVVRSPKDGQLLGLE